jgi:hypothetical protein
MTRSLAVVCGAVALASCGELLSISADDDGPNPKTNPNLDGGTADAADVVVAKFDAAPPDDGVLRVKSYPFFCADAGSSLLCADFEDGTNAPFGTPRITASGGGSLAPKVGANPNAVGNALEVAEAIEILQGKVTGDLLTVALELSANMLRLAGRVKTNEEALHMLSESLHSGRALQKFGEIIKAQGGNENVIRDISILPRA